jgi:hypothetical protein
MISVTAAVSVPSLLPLMERLAIPLSNQPKSFWPGTRKTVAKWVVIPLAGENDEVSLRGVYNNQPEKT